MRPNVQTKIALRMSPKKDIFWETLVTRFGLKWMPPEHTDVRFDILGASFEIVGRIAEIPPAIQGVHVWMEPQAFSWRFMGTKMLNLSWIMYFLQ